ncbi:MAG TPA: hypothetical protein PKX93_08620, partial [bacterium]|nr:hypothetical protein [bacterium]
MKNLIAEVLAGIILTFSGLAFSAINITGRVTELNPSDFQPAPVAGVTVRFLGTTLQTTSDSQGNYTLTGVPAESFGISLKASKTGYVDTYMMPMGFGQHDEELDIMIFSTTLHSQFLHRTGAPSHTSGKGDIVGRVGEESGISGVVISARYADTNTDIPSSQIRYFNDMMMPVTGSTYSNGIFCVYNVEPDRPIKITASKAGSYFNSPLVVGYANSITVCGVMPVDSLMSVSGKTMWDEQPVGGVSVSLPGTNISTTSDASGNFTLSNISPFSAYFLKTSKTNYKDTYYLGFLEQDTKNGSGSNLEVGVLPVADYNQVMTAIGQSHTSGKGDLAGDVEMEGVVVKIYDKNGSQVNKKVYYFTVDGPPDPNLTSTTADGGFLIVNLDPGLYYLRPEKEGFEFPVVVFNIFANGVTFMEKAETSAPRLYKYSQLDWQVLPEQIQASARNVEMLRFNLWRDPDSENVIVNSITFTGKGTGSLASAVSSAKLYCGSTFNAGSWETYLGQGVINGNKIVFSNLSLEVWETGEPARMVYLVFDFNGNASPGETFGADILSNSDIQAVGKISGTAAVCQGEPVYGKVTTIAHPQPPAQPVNSLPANGATGVNAFDYVLIATNFNPAGGNESWITSQWQLWKQGESSQTPTYDAERGPVNSIWRPVPLEANTTYYWRVRYQNGDYLWSPWSEATWFTTGSNGMQRPGQPKNQWPEEGATSVSLTPL